MPLLRVLLALGATLALGACLKAYKIDIQQGNVVTQEMVDKLRPGMTRAQVRYVLGTPLVTDPFHKDRWDYFYSYKKGVEGVPESRRLTLLFKDDVLYRVQGDVAVKNPSGEETSKAPEAPVAAALDDKPSP